jgi:hypothetical protein
MRLVLLSIGALLLMLSPTLRSTAHASYNCGTGWTLYTTSGGIRCVKRTLVGSPAVEGYAWYGEGSGQWGKYRHIGVVRSSGQTNTFTGSSADINGNGEDLNQFVDGGMTLTRSSATAYPTTFTVAPWSETWTQVTSTTYTSPFTAPATDCGSNFYSHAAGSKMRKYKSYLYTGSALESRVGIRCVLGLTAGAMDVWYGAGEQRTRPSTGANYIPTPWSAPTAFAHLGVRGGTSFGQFDLCNNPGFCIQRDFGAMTSSSVTLPDTGNGIKMDGTSMTSELWIPSRRKHSLRLQPIKVANTNGSNATPVTVTDVRDLVTRANAVYAAADTEFLFNTALPQTSALLTVFDNTLNAYSWNPVGSAEWNHANFLAEQMPSDVAAIFTWGPGGCPTTGGISGSDWSWISTVAVRGLGAACGGDHTLCGIFDDGQLAHEAGHYLGLPHTFKTAFADTNAAITAWEGTWNPFWGCIAKNAFDGDPQSNTPLDPYITTEQCTANASVTLNSFFCGNVTFPLPRTNIMSYYKSPAFPNDKTLTPEQKTVIENLLSTSALRQRLE